MASKSSWPRGPGSLALDFLDTVRLTHRGAVDLMPAPGDLLAWLEARGLGVTVSVPAARILHSEARRLRADIADIVDAHAQGASLPAHALHGVNRVLEASRRSWRLDRIPDGLALTDREVGTGDLAALAPIAFAAALLVTDVDAARVRRCASPGCRAWFVDTSKGGRRRWCSMSRCGNRAKAAGHRARASRKAPPGASLPLP